MRRAKLRESGTIEGASQVSSLISLPLVSRVRRPAWPRAENRESGERKTR